MCTVEQSTDWNSQAYTRRYAYAGLVENKEKGWICNWIAFIIIGSTRTLYTHDPQRIKFKSNQGAKGKKTQRE